MSEGKEFAEEYAALAATVLRRGIEERYEAGRERALALTKLDECMLWLGQAEPRKEEER